MDETRIFLKNDTKDLSLSREEKSLPGYSPMKKIFTVLLHEVFAQQDLKKYLENMNMAIRDYLLMENTPIHPRGLEEDLTEVFGFIKIMFLLPNIQPWLPHIDQLVHLTDLGVYLPPAMLRISFGEQQKDRNPINEINLIDENRYKITKEELEHIPEEQNRTLTVEISSDEDE
ncbi:hypothetical protein RF11_06157 [Thelohanellus kitauei]|uniref:Uncharacterized protein n=1 Tax=Thelohanellus kitauei TaxID=669202 RepID=A0A0C2NLA8_THEKT|nr:hypothetical protein RF11_06157 [Thelohanellus kitauei]